MEKKNTGKYFKYAIGEIVLVVIGILIAVQINNWNMARLESQEEKNILLNLKQDFHSNYTFLDSIMSYQKSLKPVHFSILNHTGNKPKDMPEKQFDIALNAVFRTSDFYPRTGALDDLINSGKLGILKSAKLRSNLSSWNPVLRQLKFREEVLSITQKALSVLIIKKASWLNIDLVASSSTTKTNAFPISGFDIDNRNLLNELEFENIIENIVYENDLVIFEQKNTLELISKISKLIEIELNK
jgi:hypothetical protein